MPYAWPIVDGVLQIGGTPADLIADRHDTPCYVTDAAVIRERYLALASAFAPWAPNSIAYACKANANYAVLALLAREGAHFDVVSPGEAEAVRRAGVPPDKIMFTGTNPRDDELAWLIKQGCWINCDAVSVARRVAAEARGHAFSVRIGSRVGAGHHEHVVTGGEGTQFGIRPDDLPTVLDTFHAGGHRLTRLHAHIGSGILAVEPYLALIDELADVVARIKGHPAVAIDTVDIGGGIGIPYRPTERPIDCKRFAKRVATHFRRRFGPQVVLMLEPGRFLVAESTVLLTRVTTIKSTPQTTFLGVDAGFNALLRPILYDAYHHIAAATKMTQPPSATYSICGPLCETGDILARERALPAMAEGDLVAIFDTGAYGFAMASTYNSRPRPAEVMVLDGTVHLIREREQMEDLFRLQRIPDALA